MGGAGTALAEGGHQQHDLDSEGRLGAPTAAQVVVGGGVEAWSWGPTKRFRTTVLLPRL